MKFATYYNVTNRMKELMKEKALTSFNIFTKYYVCQDVHDFWICRVQENLNIDYEPEDGTYLLERHQIDHYDFITFLEETQACEVDDITNRQKKDSFLNGLSLSLVVDHLLLLDEKTGFENDDCDDFECFEDCEETIDDGFGILPYPEAN